MEKNFIEQDCTFTVEGQSFTSGGSWIAECTDGKTRGVVYVNEKTRSVTTWRGDFIAKMHYTDYQGNFCKMRRVSFSYNGKNFVGDYCPDWSEACKVRSTK